MDQLRNAMLVYADLLASGIAVGGIGIVDSYDPNTYSAKVRLQPENGLTNWWPILSPWVGNQWGLFCPPAPGDQVAILHLQQSLQVGVIVGSLYSDQDRPVAVDSGEFWLLHASGSKLQFKNDGSVNLVAHAGITSSATSWNHTGSFSVDGDITSTGDVSDGVGALSGLRGHYNIHTHTDPQGGSTGPTDTLDP